jgi:hypothetical protein
LEFSIEKRGKKKEIEDGKEKKERTTYPRRPLCIRINVVVVYPYCNKCTPNVFILSLVRDQFILSPGKIPMVEGPASAVRSICL